MVAETPKADPKAFAAAEPTANGVSALIPIEDSDAGKDGCCGSRDQVRRCLRANLLVLLTVVAVVAGVALGLGCRGRRRTSAGPRAPGGLRLPGRDAPAPAKDDHLAAGGVQSHRRRRQPGPELARPPGRLGAALFPGHHTARVGARRGLGARGAAGRRLRRHQRLGRGPRLGGKGPQQGGARFVPGSCEKSLPLQPGVCSLPLIRDVLLGEAIQWHCGEGARRG